MYKKTQKKIAILKAHNFSFKDFNKKTKTWFLENNAQKVFFLFYYTNNNLLRCNTLWLKNYTDESQ